MNDKITLYGLRWNHYICNNERAGGKDNSGQDREGLSAGVRGAALTHTYKKRQCPSLYFVQQPVGEGMSDYRDICEPGSAADFLHAAQKAPAGRPHHRGEAEGFREDHRDRYRGSE